MIYSKYFSVLVIAIFFACSSNTGKNTINDKSLIKSESSNMVIHSTVVEQQGEGIVGKWLCKLTTLDENKNYNLDANERKKAVNNLYELELRGDGTCRIQNMFTGTYTIKIEQRKQVLQLQRKRIVGEEDKDPPPQVFYITSVTKDELVLEDFIGNEGSFWIFKRV